MPKALKKILLVLIGACLIGIGGYLFFGEEVEFFIQNSKWFETRQSAKSDKAVLTIGYSLPPNSLDPTEFNLVSRRYVVDIYEGLIKSNRNLKNEAGLAVSWGVVRDNIWEFRLRPNVFFHNGKALNADDVVYSINYAQTAVKSELRNLLIGIKTVKAVSNDKVLIETIDPDPLLLTKLSSVFIFPKDYNDFTEPVGTGPYKFIKQSKDELSMERFDDYWGKKPSYKNVFIKTIVDRKQRISALDEGAVDILADVPPNVACSFTSYSSFKGCNKINNDNYAVKSIPSLEVSFIMFNPKNEVLKDMKIRKALTNIFEYVIFEDMAFGFAVPASQFVSNGVFGYNPDIKKRDYDISTAKELINKLFRSSFERPTIIFDYPDVLQPIGSYVRDQFSDVGIDIVLNPLQPALLESKIKLGESEMYFFGWKSEQGDAADFLFSVVHSKGGNGYGVFNGINYRNVEVDDALDSSRSMMDPEKRLKLLQKVMKQIIEEDVVGVPLFESETIFAFHKDIVFDPRIDGYILASEIK
jgi:peptide/nickel transport system substrate-binding protein